MVYSCGSSTPTNPTPAVPSATQVIVTGSTPAMGGSSQFTATATLSDGSTQNVTSQAAWTSSNQNVATVSATGSVTAVSGGTARITATYQERSGLVEILILASGSSVHTLSGVVTDAKAGYVLERAEVRVTSGVNVGMSARTDEGGRYTLSDLEPGPMTIRATASQSTWEPLERSMTLAGDSQLDFALPRAASTDPNPPAPSPSFGTGAFIDIVTTSLTCQCSEGSIVLTANGKRLGSTSCEPRTRRFEVGPGSYTLQACDDLGCWEDIDETLEEGDEWEVTLTCANLDSVPNRAPTARPGLVDLLPWMRGQPPRRTIGGDRCTLTTVVRGARGK